MQEASVSLRHGGSLRKVYGHGGIAVEATVNLANGADPTNLQLRVSSEQLPTSITSLGSLAALSATVGGINPSTFLPNTGPATLTGNLTSTGAFNAGSLETGHALLSPLVIAPSTADLALRNYSNHGGLSVSNATPA